MANSIELNTKPPDWRWQRCTELIHTNQSPTSTDDEWIREGTRYLKAFRKASTEDQILKVATKYSGPFWAHRVRNGLTSDSLHIALDGLLRAAEPIPVVAQLTNLTPEAIEAYAALFYDDEGRRNNLSRPDVLELFSSDIGTYVLDAAIARLRERPGGIDQLDNESAHQLCSLLWLRLAVELAGPDADPDIHTRVSAPVVRYRIGNQQPQPLTQSNCVLEIKSLLEALQQVSRTDTGNQGSSSAKPVKKDTKRPMPSVGMADRLAAIARDRIRERIRPRTTRPNFLTELFQEFGLGQGAHDRR